MKIKKRWIFLILFSLLTAYILENRNFYCLTDGRCITVWKTIGGNCYIIPYKYYSPFPPSNNYIQTSNLSGVEIFFSKKATDEIIVRSSEKIKIVTTPSLQTKISNFYDNEEIYKELLFNKDGEAKDNVSYFDLDIAEKRLIRKKD